MATLGDPDVFGPEDQDEEKPYRYGFTMTVTRRTNLLLRVTWPIDNTGGESAPATWTLGANTYQKLGTSVDRGYGKVQGHFTATYRKEGTWTPVIP